MPKAKPPAIESNIDGDPELYRQAGIVYRVIEKPVVIRTHQRNRWEQTTFTTPYELRTDNGTFNVMSIDAAHATVKQIAACKHKGAAFYAREMRKSKQWKPAGPRNLKPPSFKRFGQYRWDDAENDFVLEHRELAAAVRVTDGCEYATDRFGQRTAKQTRVPVTAEVYNVARNMARTIRRWKLDGYYLAPQVVVAFRDDAGDHWLQLEYLDGEGEFLLPELEWNKTGAEYRSAWPDGAAVRVSKCRSKWEVEVDTGSEYGRTRGYCDTLTAAKHRAAELYAESKQRAANDAAYDAWQAAWNPADAEKGAA